MQGKMRSNAPIAVSVLGLLIVVPAFASPQESEPSAATAASASYGLPPNAVVDEIKFIGLHRIAPEAAKSKLSFHPGENFDSARIAADVRALNRLGCFEDVFVQVVEPDRGSETPAEDPPHFQLEFHVQEYPLLTGVAFSGSKILSQHQIEKLLEDKRLSPQVGTPANPVTLHRVAAALQSELAAMGHPEARALIRQEKLSGQRLKIEFQIHDGPHLPVVAVRFSGHPEISDKILRKQMHQVSPDAWLSGFRNKNLYTQDKVEQDRVNLLTYLRNHGFPQARVGAAQLTVVDAPPHRSFSGLHHRSEPGLSVGLPVEAGSFFTFGPADFSAPLRQRLNSSKKGAPISPDFATGRPFSQQTVESLRRGGELWLRRKATRPKTSLDYRLHATTTFDGATHTASVRFDLDPTPPCLVRRIEFRGNQRFPDRYLRRRIGLQEGQPLDDYALEAGLARLARTGYFQPLKKEDVHIETQETGRVADVTIQLHEKGKQRIAFSGGPAQFGSTVGTAYTIFNLLGLDEFLTIQMDGGPETLQLAAGLAKEGFLGSRGTLALSVFDTFLRPHFAPGPQAPFQRTQTEGVSVGWSYAASDVDAIGVNFRISRSLTESVLNQPPGTPGPQLIDLRSESSSHSLGIGWIHDSGEQKIQLTDSVSGGWLGGNENLLKSKVEYGHIFPDDIFNRHNAWAFRTTVSAAGSYNGDMPLSARFFSSDDLVRGLRPGELGPYQTVAAISPSGTTTYSAVPSGADLIAASNLEYRFPLARGVEGAAYLDMGSGLLLPSWLGPARPSLISSTNRLIHASMGFELHWTLPAIGVPLRMNYSFNILRLNRALLMPDGSLFRVHDRLAAFGWALGPLF
jgi:outer membrane protein insertion porin family